MNSDKLIRRETGSKDVGRGKVSVASYVPETSGFCIIFGS